MPSRYSYGSGNVQSTEYLVTTISVSGPKVKIKREVSLNVARVLGNLNRLLVGTVLRAGDPVLSTGSLDWLGERNRGHTELHRVVATGQIHQKQGQGGTLMVMENAMPTVGVGMCLRM